MKTYKAIPRRGISDRDAEAVGTFIEQKFGAAGASPEELVEASRGKRTPTHKFFEWDDSKAAQSHRVWQARHLMGSIEVVVVNQDGGERAARAFHSVNLVSDSGEKERRYVPQEVVWSSPNLSDQVLAAAARELDRWADRYEQYQEMHNFARRVRSLADEVKAA